MHLLSSALQRTRKTVSRLISFGPGYALGRCAPPHRKRAHGWALLGTRRGLDALHGGLSRSGDEFHVICRKSVAPYILDSESTRPFSGALVHDLQTLLSARKKIIFSPLAQGDDYREELAALLG